jgi:hypothetical protein
MREIKPGDKVIVRSVDNRNLPRRAMTGVVEGDTFPVVWVCREEQWTGKTPQILVDKGVPWPVEDVKLEGHFM